MAIINSHWPLASTLALLFCLHLVSYGALATGDFADFVTEPVTTAATVDETNRATGTPYLTDYVIKGSRDGETPEMCSSRVINARKEALTRPIERGVQPTVNLGAALLIFLFVGVFAAGIAYAFQMVRKHVYHDADNLDTAFDAGGKVSIGLTATTIVSQWTWSATLLQSSTVASKYGISGPYWYAGGATIQIIIFSILSIMLKTRAPGAKTFLQSCIYH